MVYSFYMLFLLLGLDIYFCIVKIERESIRLRFKGEKVKKKKKKKKRKEKA